MSKRGKDWCILRTGGASTLRLHRTLAAAGFEVWTPLEVQVRRDRRTGERHERMVAVMPTYVFAHAIHLPALAEIAIAPISPHPDFSVFRHQDRFPVIDDAELTSLRAIERQAAAKSERVVFPQGQAVRAEFGGFEGLTGQVAEISKGNWTLVAFPGFNIPVKFASWQLNAVDLEGAQIAAQAA